MGRWNRPSQRYTNKGGRGCADVVLIREGTITRRPSLCEWLMGGHANYRDSYYNIRYKLRV